MVLIILLVTVVTNELLKHSYVPVLNVNPQTELLGISESEQKIPKFMKQPNKMIMTQIIWTSILLLSCQDQPLSIKDCPKNDSLCRIQFAMAGWKISTKQGMELMPYLSNLEQDSIITQYFERSTSIIPPELCISARNSTTKDRCLDLLHRPHLWEGSRTAQQKGVFIDFPAAISEYSSLPLKKDDCINFGCLDKKADQAVTQQQFNTAAQYCNAIDSKKLMEECYFQIAEKMSVRFGTEFFPTALDICLGAGEYQVNCLEHVIELSIDRNRPYDFLKHTQLINGIKEFAESKVPSMKGRLVSKYWSSFSYDWMIQNKTIQWIDQLPNEARIEWFCTATYFFFSQLSKPIEIKNHLQWIQLIEGYLQKGLTFQPLREPGQPLPENNPKKTHIVLPNKEYRTLAKHYARIHSENENFNKSICVVEAAFYHQKDLYVEYSDLKSSTDQGIQRLFSEIPSSISKD